MRFGHLKDIHMYEPHCSNHISNLPSEIYPTNIEPVARVDAWLDEQQMQPLTINAKQYVNSKTRIVVRDSVLGRLLQEYF